MRYPEIRIHRAVAKQINGLPQAIQNAVIHFLEALRLGTDPPGTRKREIPPNKVVREIPLTDYYIGYAAIYERTESGLVHLNAQIIAVWFLGLQHEVDSLDIHDEPGGGWPGIVVVV